MSAPLTKKERTEAQTKYLEKLEQGWWVFQAAEYSGVSRRTVTNWRKSDPEFAAEESEALAVGAEVRDEKVEANLHAQTASNAIAGQVWLYNRRPDRWADRRSQEVSLKTTDSTIKVILGTTVRPDGDTEESGKAS